MRSSARQKRARGRRDPVERQDQWRSLGHAESSARDLGPLKQTGIRLSKWKLHLHIA